jgi:hypothetical protein
MNAVRFPNKFLLICTAQSRQGDCTVAVQEVMMRIHSSQISLNTVNPYSAAAEKAAAAQRAADVRKKLLKGVAEIEGAPTPEEAFMIGQWMDSRHSQVQSQDQNNAQYHAGASGKDPDFG